MPFDLTEAQQKELDASVDGVSEAVDPRTGRRFTLVPSDAYEAVRDQIEQEAWARMSMRNLARRLAEDE